jgi:hypothetical protein
MRRCFTSVMCIALFGWACDRSAVPTSPSQASSSAHRRSRTQPWGMSPLISASKPGYFADIRFTNINYSPTHRMPSAAMAGGTSCRPSNSRKVTS